MSEVFRTPFASMSQKCHGCAGSGPYIAPEEFERQEYDAELIDVWAIGVIYWVMCFNSLPWSSAQMKDQHYKYYFDHYRAFAPLNTKVGILPQVKELMYGMLDPNPDTRVSIKGIRETEWFKSLIPCVTDDDCLLVDSQPLPHNH